MPPTSRNFFSHFANVVFPGTGAEKKANTGSAWPWLFHGLFWISVLVGCWHLGELLGLRRWLRSPWPALHSVWLPLLVVFAYLLAWLCIGLWSALQRRAATESCPQLEREWNQMLRHLEKASVNVPELPLFLILGQLLPDLKALLESLGATPVKPLQSGLLEVFYNTEAIFVVAGNSSLLSTRGQHDPLSSSGKPVAESEGDVPSRLYHLCGLIRRDRPPERALQGAVLTVPFPALQTETEMRLLTASCQDDLYVIRQGLGLDCPLFVVVNDLNDLPRSAANGWMQRFPLMPDCEPDEMSQMLKGGLDRLFLETIPPLVRDEMTLDPRPPSQNLSETLRANIREYRVLSSAHAWKTRLCRFMTEGTWNDFAEPGLVGGCYFLPRNPNPRSGVTQALWADLLSHGDTITWTPETWTQRDRERSLIRRGYGLILVGWASAVVAAVWVLVHRI